MLFFQVADFGEAVYRLFRWLVYVSGAAMVTTGPIDSR